jgi:hypothetical protein
MSRLIHVVLTRMTGDNFRDQLFRDRRKKAKTSIDRRERRSYARKVDESFELQAA